MTRWTRRGRTAGIGALLGVVLAFVLTPSPAQADQYGIEISNLESRLRADVMWGSTAAYTKVFLWPDNTSASQEFDILDSGGGWFRIRARHSNQCLMLDWRQGAYVNGTKVIQYPYCQAGYAAGEWKRGWAGFRPECDLWTCRQVSTTLPVLINRATGKCLDAFNPKGGAPPAQAVLQQWECIDYADDWNAGNQLWRFGNEYYY